MMNATTLSGVVQDTLTNKPIDVTNITVAYQHKKAIENVSASIEPGKITGIIGPNGAGKSTLLKAIIGLIKTETGQVSVNGQSIDAIRKNIAYVEQRSAIDLTFPIKVDETVLLGTFPNLGLFRRPKKEQKEKVIESLKKVKMEDFAKRQIGNLSGGQLQRVFIARALAQEADIIFLDEPFVGIDMVSEKVIVDLLKQLRDEGKTIVIVHHDLHKTREYFDNLIILNKKLVAEGSVETTFVTKNIQAAYGDSMGEIVIKGVND
ncbi:metal ABC transporter ATP-binding protein [Vagococcus carniphilus]|uniref:Metal ABC transporter ATP-binding protein n=2 Tax=Vagococcus carniphilus TaxID=218144 RepID=A0AAW8U7F1_9ENTE|nr:metal ABC transporter ATP-binding protein [Vagococcus carniphilus]MDT2830326.1 metal ABC transporter ATP-binding protein [Vagococcus carniphilus]MDT2834247.1 metal ABC transporter ATP-binding protein [Vagococcus carniphilus]MDT2840105.1 metal ABC transporter ATP-binding protein [Vagococcus carniphilus]MDT2847906.1 metal ABC transporter ATP-binding protein [Vagococcus carniphilus]MDT2854596.1 metal ABC transporter ATP-binding protein [Vagococcus carniphilus]